MIHNYSYPDLRKALVEGSQLRPGMRLAGLLGGIGFHLHHVLLCLGHLLRGSSNLGGSISLNGLDLLSKI